MARTLQPLAAHAATWTQANGAQSEIDHVLVHPQQRHLWAGRAEVRPGVHVNDHKTLWVEFRGANQDDDEDGEQRPVGRNWKKLSDGGWEKYQAALREWSQRTAASAAVRDVREEIRSIEEATKKAAEEQWEAEHAPEPDARETAARPNKKELTGQI